jgi:hypothetical protein
MHRMREDHDGNRTRLEVNQMAEEEVNTDLASLVAQIARDECKKMYEKRLTGLEEELAAVYRRFEEYTGRT